MERFLEMLIQRRKGEGGLQGSGSHQTRLKALNVLRCYGALAKSARRCLAALEIPPERLSWGHEQQHDDGGSSSSGMNPGRPLFT
ncbi:hypothetical protein BDW71DRAFT_188175 [Aspergillus fruticulosus]